MNQIDSEVLEILEDCTVMVTLDDTSEVRLPDKQLDRKLYVKVNKVLENLGGKWSRREKAHVFQTDVTNVFEEVVHTGMYEAKLDELNKVYNFFPTPAKVAKQLVELAGIQEGERVLEPSAGKGAIARAIRDEGHEPLCIELNQDLIQELLDQGFSASMGDFMHVNEGCTFDVIIANPPFSKARDAKHIMKMIKLTKRRVVTICSAAVQYRKDGAYKDLSDMLHKLDTTMLNLPEGSFKESGTMVSSCILIIDK